MSDLEYAKMVRELIDSILPQARNLVLDIGLVNELALESSKRIREASDES